MQFLFAYLSVHVCTQISLCLALTILPVQVYKIQARLKLKQWMRNNDEVCATRIVSYVIPTSEVASIADLEADWTGNEVIKTVDDVGGNINIYYNYVKVRSITKDNVFVVGYDDSGNEITEAVYSISVEKKDIAEKSIRFQRTCWH